MLADRNTLRPILEDALGIARGDSGTTLHEAISRPKPNAALAAMPWVKMQTRPKYRQHSCTANALAVLICHGEPSRRILDLMTRALLRSRVDADEVGHFGRSWRETATVYRDEFGLEYREAVPDGQRYPRTCILRLRSKFRPGEDGDPQTGHLVARIDGTLVDRIDPRDDGRAWEIDGYWKPPKPGTITPSGFIWRGYRPGTFRP